MKFGAVEGDKNSCLRKTVGIFIILWFTTSHITVAQADNVIQPEPELISNGLSKDESLFAEETLKGKSMEDIKNIRSHLNQIVKDLEKARGIFSMSRKTRQTDKCLTNLIYINEIKTALTESRNSTCTFIAANCDELIQLLLCGYGQFDTEIKQTIFTSNKTAALNQILINIIKFINTTDKIINEIKSQFSIDNQQKLIKISGDIQVLKNITNYLIVITTTNLAQCIINIKNGQIDDAYTLYNHFNGPINFNEIITTVYNDGGKLNQTKNLMAFYRRIVNCIHNKEFAYEYINLIEANILYGEPEMAVFYDIITLLCPVNLNDVKIENSTQKFVLKTTSMLKTSGDDRTKILRYINSFASAPHAFTTMYYRIVTQLYDKNVINCEFILSWLKEVILFEDKYEIFNALINEMKLNSHLATKQLITVSYRIWEIIYNNWQIFEGNEKHKKLYNELINKIPSSPRALMFNESVVIESRLHDGNTLFGMIGLADFGVSTYLFTCPNNYYECGGKNQLWRVHKIEANGIIYFRFENVQNHRFIQCNNEGRTANCAYKTEYDSNIVCATDKLDSHWEVNLIEDAKYVYFKNRANNRVLDANNRFGDCSLTHAWSEYLNTLFHQWKIR